jgi:putative tryptophan/tyrosine transport system substrate-binding protein
MQLNQLRRREFITLIASAAVWPLAAHAQPPAKLPIVGFLGPVTPSAEGLRLAALIQRLGELGWIGGRNVAIEVRWGEGRPERYREIAAEFVRLDVDVIVTGGTQAVMATKQVTSSIPIIFTTVADPVGLGFVASLARPGGNVTGLSMQQSDIGSKRLGLLREVIPGLGRLGIMTNVGSPAAILERDEVHAAADLLGLRVDLLDIRRTEDIAAAFDALKGRVDALYLVNEPLVNFNRVRINTMALGARLPTMHSNRENVELGGLMSYGPNILDNYRRAGDYVDKILRGTKASEIPVEQPTKFELIVNLITAKVLGVEIPPTLLARADEVIE